VEKLASQTEGLSLSGHRKKGKKQNKTISKPEPEQMEQGKPQETTEIEKVW
jgi:hypothetical protein